MPLIDDVVDQTAIQPGDILVFDGEGANPGSGRQCQSGPIYWAQNLFFKSDYSSSYMHVAVCSAKSDANVEICHLTDTSVCSGSLKVDTRNVSTKPFGRSFIILRPPQDWQAEVVNELETAKKQRISTSNFAYFKTLYHPSKSENLNRTTYKKENTCVGFVINVMHLAAQKLGKQYPLAVETSTVELLNHTRRFDGEHKGWQMLLVPGYKKILHDNEKPTYEPVDLIKTIKQWAKGYQDVISKKWLGGMDKGKKVQSVLDAFTYNPKQSEIKNAKRLLDQLKPEMENSRVLGRSKSFDHLLQELESSGFHREYLGAFKASETKNTAPTFTGMKYL